MKRRKRRAAGAGGYSLGLLACMLALVVLALSGWWLLPTGTDPLALPVQGGLLPRETPAPTPFPGGPEDTSDPVPAPTPVPDEPLDDRPAPTPEPVRDENDPETLYQVLYAAALAQQSSVTVNCDDQELVIETAKLLYQRPELFWIESMSTQSSGGSVEVFFEWKYDDIPARIREVEQVAQEAMASVPAGAGEFDTAVAIHDWLCEHIVYEFSTDGSDQDIYGALVNGRCVCAGYSAAYEYLLTRMGMQAWTVEGKADNGSGAPENHAWNKVQMEGQIYYTDVTWDDRDGGYSHFWFGLTSELMGRTHFDEGYNAPMTSSNAVACNYYYRQGLLLDLYDEERLVQLLAAQSGPELFVCAADQDTYDRLIAAVSGKEVYSLLARAGHTAHSLLWSPSEGTYGVRIEIKS